MPAKRKGARRKYGKAASKSVERALHKEKRGTLKSGRSGKTVTSREQAIAIGLSEARKREQKFRRPQRRNRLSSDSQKSYEKERTPKKSSVSGLKKCIVVPNLLKLNRARIPF